MWTWYMLTILLIYPNSVGLWSIYHSKVYFHNAYWGISFIYILGISTMVRDDQISILKPCSIQMIRLGTVGYKLSLFISNTQYLQVWVHYCIFYWWTLSLISCIYEYCLTRMYWYFKAAAFHGVWFFNTTCLYWIISPLHVADFVHWSSQTYLHIKPRCYALH